MTGRLLHAVAVLGCLGTLALAEDEPTEKTKIEGEVTVGWRVVSDENEGRFPQDHGLQDGPRLFDLRFRAYDLDSRTPVNELEGEAFGVGDRNSTYRLTLRGDDGLRLRGGFDSDDYSYRATGDPFPLDSSRERGWTDGRVAIDKDHVLRFGWERRTRRGEAFASADTNLRTTADTPAGVDPDLVRVRRPFDQRFDTYTLGVDGGQGVFRYGLTQTVTVGVIDDERFYDVPRSRRGGTPARELFRRQVRSKTTTTVAKGGATLLDGDLDLAAFLTYSRVPLDSRISGESIGDSEEFSGGTPKGPFTGVTDGDTRTRRTARGWRAEATYRVTDDVDVLASAEQFDVIDDSELNLTEVRNFERLDVGTETTVTRTAARITDRTDRQSLEVEWQATDDLRLRGGYEQYTQDLEVPTETPGFAVRAADRRSDAWRWIAGVDAKPLKGLSLGALVKHGRNDAPISNVSSEETDEGVLRIRYRHSNTLSGSLVVRARNFDRGDDFRSSTRTRSFTGTASWSPGAFTLTSTVSFQEFDTYTTTKFFEAGGGPFTTVQSAVRFRTRDTILSLDAGYEITPTLRAHARGTGVSTEGDYGAWYHELEVGAAYDLSEEITVGARLRGFRLDERTRNVDDYGAEALEFSLTYRF